jgi:hypothetical protein
MIGQALWILRKDIRHLWPRALVFWFLAALYAVADASMPRNPVLGTGGFLLALPLGLAACFLVISVIHEDRIPGDRQFWLTRPYSWQGLALAKGMFLLVFINLPVLLEQIAALAANGLSPLHYGPQLLARQVVLMAGTLLPCAALAAVTASIVQVVLAILAGYAALFVVVISLSRMVNFGSLTWGCAAPVLAVSQAAVLFLAAVLVCVVQYRHHATLAARCIFACGLAASLSFLPIVPWHAAFAWVAWRSPAIDPMTVRLAPDPARKLPANGGYSIDQGRVPVFLPIQVDGIPDGMEVYSERVRVTVAAPNRESWDSGWSPLSEVRDKTLASSATGRLLPGEGAPYWLRVNIDGPFYSRCETEPVHLRATVAFTLLNRAHITRIVAREQPQPIGDNGFCSVSKRGEFVTVPCLEPLRFPTVALIRFQPGPSGAPPQYGYVEGIQPESPGGSVFSIWEMLSGGLRYGAPPEPFAVSVETRRAVGHFERDLDMPDIRLADYRSI